MDVSKLTKTFLEMLSQIKVLHWTTSKYSIHIALDELHDTMSKSTDDFIESFMGKNNVNKDYKLSFKTDSQMNVIDTLKNYHDTIKSLHSKFKKDTELQTILDDMMNAFNKAMYLCKLD